MVASKDISFNSKSCGDNEPKVRLNIADSIELLNKTHWDEVLQGQDLLLSTDYLRALELAMDESMEFRYVVYYCENFQPQGIAYFQVADLADNGSKYAEAVKGLGKGIGGRIVSELKVRSLVCGNVFHCGEHGYVFKDTIDAESQLAIVERTLDRIKQDGDLESRVGIVLFKEFRPEHFPLMDSLNDKGYHMFRMDMNMILDLRPHWTDLDTYLQDLTSKARTRVKSILKRSDSLRFVDMDVEAIKASLDKINSLFKEVLKGSPFTFGVLEMDSYVEWKKRLGDRLLFQGVYHGEEMIGFQSAFFNEGEMEVHYVGIDYEKNEELAIYQRMLIELLRVGIARQVGRIGYGRTAEQAKSNLGAKPLEMRLYTKHRNLIANKLIKPLMRSVVPTEFELRDPFKKVPA